MLFTWLIMAVCNVQVLQGVEELFKSLCSKVPDVLTVYVVIMNFCRSNCAKHSTFKRALSRCS